MISTDDKSKVMEKALELMKEGLRIKDVAVSFGVAENTMWAWLRNYEPYVEWRQNKLVEDRKDYVSVQAEKLERSLTTDQVEKLKQQTMIGEALYYDYNAAGIPLAGIVKAKYPHMALLECGQDSGGYPWNVLATMNRKKIK